MTDGAKTRAEHLKSANFVHVQLLFLVDGLHGQRVLQHVVAIPASHEGKVRQTHLWRGHHLAVNLETDLRASPCEQLVAAVSRHVLNMLSSGLPSHQRAAHVNLLHVAVEAAELSGVDWDDVLDHLVALLGGDAVNLVVDDILLRIGGAKGVEVVELSHDTA